MVAASKIGLSMRFMPVSVVSAVALATEIRCAGYGRLFRAEHQRASALLGGPEDGEDIAGAGIEWQPQEIGIQLQRLLQQLMELFAV